MLQGLMNRAEFERAVSFHNPFMSRWESITDMCRALDNTHRLINRAEQFAALMDIRRRISDWRTEYQQKKGRSWKLSRRAQGIDHLEDQITELIEVQFFRERVAFKRRLMEKKERAVGVFRTITGIQSPGQHAARRFPGSSRHLSSEDYVLEFLDPQHRGRATVLRNAWMQSDDYERSFTQFVNNMDPDYLRQIDAWIDAGSNQHKWVKYLNDAELAAMELKPVGPKNQFKRDMDPGLFDTKGHESEPGRTGWSIFVMDEQNRIYTNSKSTMRFHHSSFLGGKPTKSAGTLKVTNGKIAGITMASGHYQPGVKQALAICRALLVKLAGNEGVTDKKQSHDNSMRAQLELQGIVICPDFKNETFYNALDFLTEGGNTFSLQKYRSP